MAINRKKAFKNLLKFAFLFLLIFGFQNCGQPFEINEQALEFRSLNSSSETCAITNGQGVVNALSNCEVVSCDAGFHLENGLCVSNVRNCAGSAVNNTQTWNGSGWDPCVVSQCSAGSHLENNSCVANTQSCIIAQGTGQRAWNGNSWNQCQAISCVTGFHLENNSCQSNQRACSAAQGSGIQSWTNNAWSACVISQCASGSVLEGGACVPEYDNRSCTVNGKVGTQGLNSGVWSACRVCAADAYTSFRGICFDNPTFAKNYASFLPGCWSNGLLTCPVSVHSGFISVPSRYSIKASESVTFNVFYMGSSNVTLSASHVQVLGPGAAGCTKSVSGSGSATRTVTLAGCQGPGAVSISILPGSSIGVSGGVLSSFGPSPDVIVTPSLAVSSAFNLKTDGTYPGANGNQIPYEMHFPSNYSSLLNIPIMVWIHGGGWTGGNAEIDRPTARLFAELGFLVFNINYTLAPPSGVAFPNFSLPATPYSIGPNDVKAFIEYLKSNVHIMNGDTSRISIAGSSAGGHLALHQATRPDNSTQFRCVVSVAGPTLLTAFRESVNYPVTRAIALNIFGDSISAMNNNSPVFNVAHFKGAKLGVFHQLQD
ncbi:MAG: alpha/beta hydrolase, partial [Bdellovibrio sp.]|nr:alpha/beta hydrolase [Bdellovibrio sp.]